MLSPLEVLAGKHILLIGTTGFLAKVMLSMLLERFSVAKIYCLVRPQRSKNARERFVDEVLGSEMMAPLRKSFGGAFDAFVADQIEVLAGDIADPGLGLDEETTKRLRSRLDLVINSAGLVNFNPPLDDALEVNTCGAREVAKFSRSLDRPRLVHISTCFVAGNRSGRIREDSEILGYFPRSGSGELEGASFDWAREVRDLERSIQEVKVRTEDAALESRFRAEAIERLKKEGRGGHERTIRAAVTNQRRRWVAEELIRIGKDRAKHWGWPNIYTYTKALGEQAVASTDGLEWSIVRPAIVESSMSYPFPGWNEGMNTSAPLAYLALKGHMSFPSKQDLILDIVPVDYVSSAIIAASAALIAGASKKVYQVATSDINACTMDRVITLVGLYRRRWVRQKEESGTLSPFRASFEERREPIPVTKERYERLSAPLFRAVVGKARRVLDDMEPERYGPFGPFVASARKLAKETEENLVKIEEGFDLFMPFVWDNKYIFRSQQTRDLFDQMNPADRSLLPFDPGAIDWHRYWLEVHLPGLDRWVFPKLEVTGPKRVLITRDYRDLAEMFMSRTEEHSRRVAFRLLTKGDVADSFTYRDVRRAALGVADFLRRQNVKPGERIMLASEGRPEWGMSYFGVILAGATAVPVDVDLSVVEIQNIARAADAKGLIASDKLCAKLQGFVAHADGGTGAASNGRSSHVAAVAQAFPRVWGFGEIFANADVFDEALSAKPGRRPDDAASIIFTSGTTGTPKGVVLLDRNFTGLTARMSALFELNRTDSVLSVLPPHHTFEFSAGLLMPLAAGASITYLEERTPDLLSRAFRETPVTALIGVPAVWESFHRKLTNEIRTYGRGVEVLLRAIMRANRAIRDHTPWNLGPWVFRPMHNAFGGNLRYLVSGGAALKSSIHKDLRGFGFNLHEGYGLTEAAPVLTVAWPGLRTPVGSVGWPLPGIEVRIHDTDESGVGEIIARGPTIMQGYLGDPAATAETIRDAWLHTGDQGRMDTEGRLYIVGRQKDVIIDTGGKNVYPDEIEELYAGCPSVKELSVVGVPAERGTGERVAALVVPDYESAEAAAQGLTREQVRDRIRDHFKDVGSKLPFARRVKLMHVWETELPKTATRKVKRPFVREQILRLEKALIAGRRSLEHSAGEGTREDRIAQSVRRTIASIAQRRLDEVQGSMHLIENLGFDSLMQLELLTALESEFPSAHITQEETATLATVDDLIRIAARDRVSGDEHAEEVGEREEAAPIHVPAPVARAGKAALGWLQRLSYERLLDVEVDGQGNIPANENFIVAANHASHLDMGLVKYALGDFGQGLATLAAKDYFFDDPIRRAYFENFTNLLPIDRHGSLKKSLRLASEALRRGESLLIFPEGTRSRDGTISLFKPAIGHLALSERIDILPIYLGGTHDALPVGSAVPTQRKLYVRIGAPISADKMLEATRGMPRAAAYRLVAERAEATVRMLARGNGVAKEILERAAEDATDEEAATGRGSVALRGATDDASAG